MDKALGQGIIASMSGIFIYLFGGLDIAFKVLVTLIVIDYITGVMAAYLEQKLSSQLGVRGIFKKIAILTTVIVAVLIDSAAGTDVLRLATIFCLCGNEGISLLENLAKLGAPIPEKLMIALLQLRGKGDTDEHIENRN